ncbi:hypothetical protein [Vibrio vulnificus]|uniref:hypothetical protein n=1 Tax=Vibrio vulnificus TaxID=672 RepID=UPI00356373DC
MTKDEKIEKKIEEIVYKAVSSLSDGRSLLLMDLNFKVQQFFERTLSDTSDKWQAYAHRVYNKLESNDYISAKQEFRSVHVTISRGLDFDEWEKNLKGTEKMNGINIGTVNASNLQVGNGNTQNNTINISISELTEMVSKSGDESAKEQLKSLLNNSTVGSLIGAGVSSLINML